MCTNTGRRSNDILRKTIIFALLVITGCLKQKEVAEPKHFVSNDGTQQTRILPWPFYTAKESKEAADAVQAANGTAKPNFKSLFALSRLSDDPSLCFYGQKRPPQPLTLLSDIYTNPDAQVSTRQAVSCSKFFQKMNEKPSLDPVAQKIEADAKSAGVDRCVYLSVALSPPIAAFLVKLKGVAH